MHGNNLKLIHALNQTANRLANGAPYQWSHQGSCNCGHLAQTVTTFSREEIHALALQKAGDWGEKAMDYCAVSGYPIDHIISTMLSLGLTQQDLNHLEQLSDPAIVKHIPIEFKPLKRNNREHVIVYLRTWANLKASDLEPERLSELLHDSVELM